MVLFGRKKKVEALETPTVSDSVMVDDSLTQPRSRRTGESTDQAPCTSTLAFLHEAGKQCGMRPYVKTYLFHYLNDSSFVVAVELKNEALQADPGVLMARWQLLQRAVMGYAQKERAPLVSLFCHIPENKIASTGELEVRAQLDDPMQAFVAEGDSTVQAMTADRKVQMEIEPTSNGNHVEVTELEHSDSVLEEFFKSLEEDAAQATHPFDTQDEAQAG